MRAGHQMRVTGTHFAVSAELLGPSAYSAAYDGEPTPVRRLKGFCWRIYRPSPCNGNTLRSIVREILGNRSKRGAVHGSFFLLAFSTIRSCGKI